MMRKSNVIFHSGSISYSGGRFSVHALWLTSGAVQRSDYFRFPRTNAIRQVTGNDPQCHLQGGNLCSNHRSMSSGGSSHKMVAGVEFVDGGEAEVARESSQDPNELHSAWKRVKKVATAAAAAESDSFPTIPRDSALYSSYSARHQLNSRSRLNTWELTRRKNHLSRTSAPSSSADGSDASPAQSSEEGVALTDQRRRERVHEAQYSEQLMNETLTDNPASKGESRSTYGLRKIPLPGVSAYQEIVSEAEEVKMNEELLKVLQDPRAAYITTETRYCVNLYERELGVPGHETLAFEMEKVAPTLQKVLHRMFYIGLIPAIPNICQVSEMIGNFAGYPVQEKPQAIGDYYGILNLISPTVLHLQHKSCPWYPRLYLSPRSLTVVTEPSLSEFKVGYKHTHQPFHSFEYGNRISNDYRIEVLFATVEVAHLGHLRDSIRITDYAAERMKDSKQISTGSSVRAASAEKSSDSDSHKSNFEKYSGVTASPSSSFVDSTDSWIRKLRDELLTNPEDDVSAVDGMKLKEEALSQQLVGMTKPLIRTSEQQQAPEGSPMSSSSATSANTNNTSTNKSSFAKRRLEALKARHNTAVSLTRRRTTTRRVSNAGTPRVIPGAPPV